MAHLQYMPGDPRMVDQLVYELKSKGIFDQFRKECIADVDTRPAYQNLRQRVENSVSTFLARQCWKPDLNKNQLREKLRKHILDGNYLEQGVERIVDQVVNPKVASVFIPQVEDLVYNYLGISRKKSVPIAETSNGKVTTEDLLPTDLEAVSPGSVKSNDDKDETMDIEMTDDVKMDTDEIKDIKEDVKTSEAVEKPKEETESVETPVEVKNESNASIDKSDIPLPTEGIKLENIPAPENSPPKVELEKIELPKEHNIPKEIPLPEGLPMPKNDKEQYFKPINLNSDDESSSDSSLRRNMSPLTPIRNYNNENSCDAQQAFDNDSDSKSNGKNEPSSFRFAIDLKSTENSPEVKQEKKDDANLAYQFDNQVNINTFNTPVYDDSSNSNNLHIDYESDAHSKNIEKVPETDHNSEDSKKDKKVEEKKSSYKSSHRSRDSNRHSSNKDKRSDSKQSSSRDSSRHDKKPRDDHSKSKSSHKERDRSRERGDKKDSRDSLKHKSSHKSSSHRSESKSHRSSSSSQRHSSKQSDDKKTSSSYKDKERSSEKSSKDRKDSKSSLNSSDKDRKSSSSSSKSKHDEKDKKKDKKDTDDHYSLSGRGNHTRRSTDRDSNDGSSSSKGSNNQTSSKASESKKDNKGSSSKSENTSTGGESASPSDKEVVINNASDSKTQSKPIRVENHLEVPIASPPRLPFVPDVTLKKPKFAANLKEAKKMMRMRKFLDEEQKRMNQEAALLLEFQANVRPSLSQVYSSIPGPELEFACVSNDAGHIQSKYKTEQMMIGSDNAELDDKAIIDDINQIRSEVQRTEMLNNNMEDSRIEENGIDVHDKNETYNENKPFSQLVDEISEYSKASERNKNNDCKVDNIQDDDNKKRTEYFEVTIITEELSETEDIDTVNAKIEKVAPDSETIKQEVENVTQPTENSTVAQNTKTVAHSFENIAQDSESPVQNSENIAQVIETIEPAQVISDAVQSNEEKLHYFAEHEKFDAELKRHQYSIFLKDFTNKNSVSDKIYLFNCDTYEENILKEVSATFGHFEIINYYRNGHLTLPNTTKSVVNVSLASEITLPVDTYDTKERTSPVFSPVKSECSFELSSDYDAKLEEMVNRTSRQQVMEIILGSVIDTEQPTIDYCTESSIDSDLSLKRKIIEAESSCNNNRPVLIPKIRKLSESDIISSTTEETEEISNNNRIPSNTRSKYFGRAKRVGLPRPRRPNLPNSPSSDKSVENYEQNTTAPVPPNGKLKSTPPRNKVQRYDKTDLYKPKLHYLSRRNNIT